MQSTVIPASRLCAALCRKRTSCSVFINRQNEFVVVLYNHPAEPENSVITSHTADKTAALLQFCRTPRTRKEIADFLGIGTVYHANKRYIQPLVEQGRLKLSIPDKPSSRKQTYTTDV
ncbi:MAG: Fic family protein [Butyricicoccus sp.]